MGRYCWGKRTADGLKKGAGYFRQAIDKDPAYAPAYVGFAYVAGSAGLGICAASGAFGKAKVLARKSLEIDETGEAHAAIGWAILLYNYDDAAAEDEFQRAIDLYPDYAYAHMWYGRCLACMRWLGEGLAENRRALQLDPLSLIAHVCYEGGIWFLRDWDRCIDHCSGALEINPDYSGVRSMLANAPRAATKSLFANGK